MDPKGRGRKRASTTEPKPHEPSESIPPARPTHERGEYDPASLWDSGTEDAAEETDAEPGDADDGEDFAGEPDNVDDLDDWDHPLRRLKIN